MCSNLEFSRRLLFISIICGFWRDTFNRIRLGSLDNSEIEPWLIGMCHLDSTRLIRVAEFIFKTRLIRFSPLIRFWCWGIQASLLIYVLSSLKRLLLASRSSGLLVDMVRRGAASGSVGFWPCLRLFTSRSCALPLLPFGDVSLFSACCSINVVAPRGRRTLPLSCQPTLANLICRCHQTPIIFTFVFCIINMLTLRQVEVGVLLCTVGN